MEEKILLVISVEGEEKIEPAAPVEVGEIKHVVTEEGMVKENLLEALGTEAPLKEEEGKHLKALWKSEEENVARPVVAGEPMYMVGPVVVG